MSFIPSMYIKGNYVYSIKQGIMSLVKCTLLTRFCKLKQPWFETFRIIEIFKGQIFQGFCRIINVEDYNIHEFLIPKVEQCSKLLILKNLFAKTQF